MEGFKIIEKYLNTHDYDVVNVDRENNTIDFGDHINGYHLKVDKGNRAYEVSIISYIIEEQESVEEAKDLCNVVNAIENSAKVFYDGRLIIAADFVFKDSSDFPLQFEYAIRRIFFSTMFLDEEMMPDDDDEYGDVDEYNFMNIDTSKINGNNIKS